MSQGIYKDGHDRADVRAFKNDVYLPQLETLGPRIRRVAGKAACTAATSCECAGKGCVELTAPDASAGPEVVPCYHDECVVQANEGRLTYWGTVGDRFYRKTKGSSVMISGFICACHGRMEVPVSRMAEFEKHLADNHPDVDYDTNVWSSRQQHGGVWGYSSFTTIQPGKAGDGWWVGTDVVRQLGQVIPIFELLHPGAQVRACARARACVCVCVCACVWQWWRVCVWWRACMWWWW